MVFSTKQMHDIAVARALERGPRVLHVGDKKIAAYALKKNELYQLFVEHGYSADRKRWISTIQAWGDENLWGELIPKEIADTSNWSCHVLFRNIDHDSLIKLQMFAENNDAVVWPRECMESVTA